MHPLIVPVCTRLMGRLKIGQLLLRLAQSLRLVNMVYSDKEKLNVKPASVMSKLPNAMADLALLQLNNLREFNRHRLKLAEFYGQSCEAAGIRYQQETSGANSTYLRFPIIVDEPGKIMTQAKKKGVILGDWYNSVVVPASNLQRVGYQKGMAPKAEEYSLKSVNLPTHHKMKIKHARKVIDLLKAEL